MRHHSKHLNQIISSQNTSIQYTKILVSTVIAFDISEVSIDLQTSMDLLRLWMNGIIYLTRSWCWSSSADEFLGFSLLFSPFSSPVLKPNLIYRKHDQQQPQPTQPPPSHLNPLLFQIDSLCQKFSLNNIRIVGSLEGGLQLWEWEETWETWDLIAKSWTDLSELALSEYSSVPPLPAWQREPGPGREEGRGEARVERQTLEGRNGSPR